MSAPNSPEEVCNLSLDLLRQNEQVTSITTPETETESLAARWYDATRRSLLRMFPWNFARKRRTIPRSATDPAFGYDDAYTLPNDFIGLVFVGEDATDNAELDFSIEGGSILVNNDGAATLQICYIWDVTNVASFDPIFLNLLVGELAVVFGNPVTGLNKSIKGMEAFRDRWEAKARAKNGHENPPRIRYSSPLIASRQSASRMASSDGTHLFS